MMLFIILLEHEATIFITQIIMFLFQITWHSRSTLYPVIIWIHSGDFLHGTAQTYPGHVLATREVVVVTFNYRLGAFGKLT